MANEFVNSFNSSIGTSDEVVYTPTITIDYATVIGVTVANILTQTITIDLYVRDTDSTEVFILKNAELETGNSIVPIGGEQKLVLLPQQELVVRSDTEASADVTVSALEITE
jgi:hypothetical protein